jgi:hypothetical protein
VQIRVERYESGESQAARVTAAGDIPAMYIEYIDHFTSPPSLALAPLLLHTMASKPVARARKSTGGRNKLIIRIPARRPTGGLAPRISLNLEAPLDSLQCASLDQLDDAPEAQHSQVISRMQVISRASSAKGLRKAPKPVRAVKKSISSAGTEPMYQSIDDDNMIEDDFLTVRKN